MALQSQKKYFQRSAFYKHLPLGWVFALERWEFGSRWWEFELLIPKQIFIGVLAYCSEGWGFVPRGQSSDSETNFCYMYYPHFWYIISRKKWQPCIQYTCRWH
jgi:hypothetical protein